MDMSFAMLLVLLLPGFLSFWVFKRITAENFDKRGEWVVFVLGLCFGVWNLFTVFLIDLIPRCSFVHSLLGAKATEEAIFLSGPFWLGYGLLVFVALISGGFAGLLRAKNLWPAHWVAYVFAKCVSREAVLVDYEGTFSYLENNEFTMDTIVRISSLSNPEKKIIGLWNGGSEMDFQLRNVHLFDDKTFPYGFPVDVCMNYGGDLLVEYITADIQDQIKLTKKLAQSF